MRNLRCGRRSLAFDHAVFTLCEAQLAHVMDVIPTRLIMQFSLSAMRNLRCATCAACSAQLAHNGRRSLDTASAREPDCRRSVNRQIRRGAVVSRARSPTLATSALDAVDDLRICPSRAALLDAVTALFGRSLRLPPALPSATDAAATTLNSSHLSASAGCAACVNLHRRDVPATSRSVFQEQGSMTS